MMRPVNFVPLGRTVSAIGFGCASLGSRVNARRGMSALMQAYDAGVSWFDVAPSYGDGEAEGLLGAFLQGRRSQVTLCTKVGILPGRASLPARILKPVAQGALRLAPALRKLAASHRPAAQRAALTGAFIESSIQSSLWRLQTDHVDVLALHDASAGDVERADVLRALEDVVSRGYARAISMAGDLAVGLRAVTVSPRVAILQLADNPFASDLQRARSQLGDGRSVGFVTHSVYGHAGALDRLAELLAQRSERRGLLESHGYRGAPREMAAAFLLDFALASNAEGVVLLSMFEPAHLRFNLERLSASPPRDQVLALATRLALDTSE